MGKQWLAVGALVFLVASCGSSSSERVSVAPPTATSVETSTTAPVAGDSGESIATPTNDVEDQGFEGDGLLVVCGAVRIPGQSLDVSTLTPFTDDLTEFIGESAIAEFDPDSDWINDLDFFEIERSDDKLVLLGERAGSAAGIEAYFDATFERVDGAWRARQWGGCWMTVEIDGYTAAELSIDTMNEPDATSTSLSLLAEERSCNSGRLPEGRDIRLLSVETADAVRVVVMVENPEGAQECPGNPLFPVAVELDAPLGDRRILDGAFSPAVELVWPTPLPPSQLRIAMVGDKPDRGRVNVVAYGGPDAARLRFTPATWGDGPGQVINLDQDSDRTIEAWVSECEVGQCRLQCEEDNCDTLVRVSTPCETEYRPEDLSRDTIVTVTFDGESCSFDTTTQSVGG